MPANTSRGYSYPLYTDSTDFPTQIQDLATDVDTTRMSREEWRKRNEAAGIGVF